jgi:2,3-bisphosphoglycerate-independent phosphoglycerate mutase
VVDVLVIPDGAADACGSLRRARMPVLRSLGEPAAVDVTPAHLPAGSETGIPVLLGHVPARPVGRGWVDAAAYGVAVPDGCVPLRADVLDAAGERASEDAARAVAHEIGPHAVWTRGHRLMLLGAASHPRVRVWPAGDVLPRLLDAGTLVVAGPGAAAGCARLMGARVVVPPGATGDVDTDLGAKAAAAIRAIEAGAARVVVHVGGPDEASHRRDAAGKLRALEAIDARLLDPLVDAVRAAAGTVTICPDHGTDPRTGRHDRSPVPATRWSAARRMAVAA